jgi:hypothetical protein
MGVKGGYASIDGVYESETRSLKDLKGECIVIDTQGLLHRMMRENIKNPYEFYLQMINFIEKMKKYETIPVFVFDGITQLVKSQKNTNIRQKANLSLKNILKEIIDTEKSDSEKSDTEKSDSEKSDSEKSDTEKSDSEKSDSEKSDTEKSDTEKSDSEKSASEKSDSEKSDKITTLIKKACNIPLWVINECKKLFDSLDCVYIHIDNYEGDQIMAEIIKSNLIKYVYSEDFDMLLFDIPYVLKSLDYINDTFKLYNKQKILEVLNVSTEELIDIAFLTGTDFNCRLYKSTFNSNLKIIQEYKTIENFKANLKNINSERKEGCKILLPTYNFDDELVKSYFTLKNIDCVTTTEIKSKLDNYFDKKSKNKNDISSMDVSNMDNIKKCFTKLKSIKLTDYISYKYTLKLSNYCKMHFGIIV